MTTNSHLTEEEQFAFSQVYELLAGIQNESTRLLRLAKKPTTSLDDLENESDRLHELAASYELALLEKGEYSE